MANFAIPTRGYRRCFDVLNIILCHDMAQIHGADRDRAGDELSAKLCGMIDRGRTISANDYDRAVATALASNMPIGVQIAAGFGHEDLVLAAASIVSAQP